MKRACVMLLMIGLTLASGLWAGDSAKKVANFTLADYNGAKHSLTDYKSSKAIVLMFIATQCPVSNSYNTRMVELQKDYAAKGVSFVGINANKQESIEEIKTHARAHGFVFPVLKDVNNVLADKLGASVTPEIYVLNQSYEILYHGRIDDSSREDRVSSRDLRMALDEILAGKPVRAKETKAFGCSIQRAKTS